MEKYVEGKFWCFNCKKECKVIEKDDELNCVECGSTFIEEIESNNEEQNKNSEDNPQNFIPLRRNAIEIPKEEQQLIFLPSTVNNRQVIQSTIPSLFSDVISGFSDLLSNSIGISLGTVNNGTLNNFLQAHHNDRQFDNFINIIMNLENSLCGNPPANPRAIEKLKREKVTEELKEKYEALTCNICLDKYNVNDVVITLDCQHEFHEKCILEWLKLRNTCPVCRYEMESNNENYERRKNSHRNNFRNMNNRRGGNGGNSGMNA